MGLALDIIHATPEGDSEATEPISAFWQAIAWLVAWTSGAIWPGYVWYRAKCKLGKMPLPQVLGWTRRHVIFSWLLSFMSYFLEYPLVITTPMRIFHLTNTFNLLLVHGYYVLRDPNYMGLWGVGLAVTVAPSILITRWMSDKDIPMFEGKFGEFLVFSSVAYIVFLLIALYTQGREFPIRRRRPSKMKGKKKKRNSNNTGQSQDDGDTGAVREPTNTPNGNLARDSPALAGAQPPPIDTRMLHTVQSWFQNIMEGLRKLVRKCRIKGLMEGGRPSSHIV